ncbi:hypothetical protein ACQ4WP_26995 [Janthinobacterium sp. GB4P2]
MKKIADVRKAIFRLCVVAWSKLKTKEGIMAAMNEISMMVEAPERKTPYTMVIDIWARWIALRDEPHSGGDIHPQDSKDFMKAGEAAELMINDLPRVNWWAMRKSQGIATVWIFPNHSLLDAVAEAEEILTPKMRNHIATRRFFN